MPEISRFLGIVIKMFYTDSDKHHKPHVHIYYGEYEALIALDGEVLSGNIPDRQYKILNMWIRIHEDELYLAWNNAVRGIPINKIEPYELHKDKFQDKNTMHISEDIEYITVAEEPVKVVEAKPLKDKMLLLKFNTGEVKLFDAELLKGIVFEPLKQEDIFRQLVVDKGVVTWLNGKIDCGPDFMYNNSYQYYE